MSQKELQRVKVVARLIEILHALEHIEEYLLDPLITKTHARYPHR